MRASDGSGEVPVPAYELFNSTDLLGEMAMTRMLAKLSTRRYRAGLEPVGAAVEGRARSTSKPAVSRRFVAATETALAELLGQDLNGLDLVALMVDGVHFGGHLCVVALGIGVDGTKHPLAVVEGATENATVVTDLLVDLRERGLDVCRPILVVVDGAKALAAARAVFDHPIIARSAPGKELRQQREGGGGCCWQTSSGRREACGVQGASAAAFSFVQVVLFRSLSPAEPSDTVEESRGPEPGSAQGPRSGGGGNPPADLWMTG